MVGKKAMIRKECCECAQVQRRYSCKSLNQKRIDYIIDKNIFEGQISETDKKISIVKRTVKCPDETSRRII